MILTPTHQFPTGTALAPERRQALVAWADERDATIIEDDYDAEFRYDRDPVGALQGLAPDRVALIGTVSKSLAPALRLGWVVCPARLLESVTEDKRLSDRGSPTLEQLALATLIESGRYDRHLRRMRDVYGARRDTLVRTLAEQAPHVGLHGLAAGFHAVAQLRAGADEQAIVEAARARSIGLYGMSSFRSERRAAVRPSSCSASGISPRPRSRAGSPRSATCSEPPAPRRGPRSTKRSTRSAPNWLLSVSRFRPRLAAP